MLISESRAGCSAHGLGAKHDLRHLDAVRRIGPAGDGAHKRLIAVLDVAVDHVEVAGVRGQVGRFDHGAAGMVQVRAEIGQLDDVVKVLERSLTAATRLVVDKGRAVDGRKADIAAAQDHVVGRVARQLCELARGHGDVLHDRRGVKEDRRALDGRAVLGQDGEHLVVVEVDADLAKDRQRGLVDLVQPFLADKFIGRQRMQRLCQLVDGLGRLAFAALRPAAGKTFVGHTAENPLWIEERAVSRHASTSKVN